MMKGENGNRARPIPSPNTYLTTGSSPRHCGPVGDHVCKMDYSQFKDDFKPYADVPWPSSRGQGHGQPVRHRPGGQAILVKDFQEKPKEPKTIPGDPLQVSGLHGHLHFQDGRADDLLAGTTSRLRQGYSAQHPEKPQGHG
jgi:hypothetical protein